MSVMLSTKAAQFTLSCSHVLIFVPPYPESGDTLWCIKCNSESVYQAEQRLVVAQFIMLSCGHEGLARYPRRHPGDLIYCADCRMIVTVS